MTSNNSCFQPVAIDTTSVYVNPIARFWAALQENMLICLVIPGSDSDCTSTCTWLRSGEMLSAYWLVCKIDFILAILSVLTALLPAACLNT